VRIDKFGAHLEAYTDTLPVITALRLCNRLGKGKNCYISKLPTELINDIERLVLEPERERCLATWSKELKCWKYECKPFGHFTPEEQEIFCAHYGCVTYGCEDEAHTIGGKGAPHGHICSGKGTCALAHSLSYEEALISMPKKLSEKAYQHECSDNRMRFLCKIKHGFLYSHRHLLKLHFGVDFWTSTTRSWVHRPIALAYLTIPSESAQQYAEPNLPARYNSDGRPLQLGGSLSPASHKRFSDALRRLDLELFIRHGDKSTPYEQERDIKLSRQTMSSATVSEAGPWPQLIKMALDADYPDVYGRN
jgi:hypothetical protein